ncbi:hypothetical protein D5I55_04375 [Chakrabartia godavariana]|nr:hypothetical protein D5I55_04375 [Chakrabartia godavariana]
MRIGALVRWLIALGIISVSLINASWIAPVRRGALELIAAGSSRGVAATARCDSTTIFGAVDRMFMDRADRVVMSVRRSGETFRIVLPALAACFEDASAAPTPERFARQYPLRRFVFDVGADDRAFLALKAGYDAAGQALGPRHAILAADAVAAHARATAPGIWAFDLEAARTCQSDYMWRGWAGLIPASCAGRTVLVPLDAQWSTWGWPNRFATRMGAAGTRMILTGPAKSGGITAVEQIPDIPRDYKGALWVADISAIGPALRD